MILHIISVKVKGLQLLYLTFNNGVKKTVNVFPLLDGPIFEPLKDPGYFARCVIDPVEGTVVWPNNADFAPEALYDLEVVNEETIIA